MFKNLKAEMARSGKTNEDLAKVTGIDKASISNKRNGKTEWTRREMYSIKTELFPECCIDYLFATE